MDWIGYRVKTYTALPGVCNPLNGDIAFKGAAPNLGLYAASAVNTFSRLAFAGEFPNASAAVPFVAGDWTANNGAAITVDAGDVDCFRWYMITPTTMRVVHRINAFTLAGAVPTIVSVKVPNAMTIQVTSGTIGWAQNGTPAAGPVLIIATAGTTTLGAQFLGALTWVNAANALTLVFQIDIEVA